MAVGTSEDLPNLPFVPFLPRPGGGRTTMAATDGQTLQRFVHEPHAAKALATWMARGRPWAGVDVTDDPAPDLVDRAPGGNRLFVALRGPVPVSGDPHATDARANGGSPKSAPLASTMGVTRM